MRLFKRKPPVEMTDDEHQQYLQELNKKNAKAFRIFGIVLWLVAMAAWTLLIVLDIKYYVGPTKIMFHGVAAAITAVIALPSLIDLFSRKKKDEDDQA